MLCRCTGYVKIVDAMIDVAASGKAGATAATGALSLARRSRASMGGPKWRARRFSAPMQLRRMRSGCAWCVRRMRRRLSHFGDLETGAPGGQASPQSSPRRTCPASTASGSFRTPATSLCLRRAMSGFAARRCALLSGREPLEGLSDADLPIAWTDLTPLIGAALRLGPRLRHPRRTSGQLLTRGYLNCGDVAEGHAQGAVTVEGEFETGFRRARLYRAGGRLRAPRCGRARWRLTACTQAPVHGPRGDRARAGRPARNRFASCADRLRRRLRRQARRLGAAAPRGRRVGDGPPVRIVYDRAEIDGLDHQAAPGPHLAPACRPTPDGQLHRIRDARPISTPAPMPPGGRRWRTACRSTRAGPTGCRTSAIALAPSTPTIRPRALFAASACRRRRSPARR